MICLSVTCHNVGSIKMFIILYNLTILILFRLEAGLDNHTRCWGCVDIWRDSSGSQQPQPKDHRLKYDCSGSSKIHSRRHPWIILQGNSVSHWDQCSVGSWKAQLYRGTQTCNARCKNLLKYVKSDHGSNPKI